MATSMGSDGEENLAMKAVSLENKCDVFDDWNFGN